MKTSKIIPNRTENMQCEVYEIGQILHSFHLYCHIVYPTVHWEHRQVEVVRSAHGGSLRYEEIGQFKIDEPQNWYVILKGENLSFHLNIKLSATLENF